MALSVNPQDLKMDLHDTATSGLGIDMQLHRAANHSGSLPSVRRKQSTYGETSRRTLGGPRAPPSRSTQGGESRISDSDSHCLVPASVSRSAERSATLVMRDLVRVEAGGSMIEFDAGGKSVGEGSRIAVDPLTPRGGTLSRTQVRALHTRLADRKGTDPGAHVAIPRDSTLLNFGSSHAQNAAELKSLLGNSHARLKLGASVLPPAALKSPSKKVRKEQAVPLEQAKARARVEVDIVLESNVCVQGDYMRGHVKIRVNKRTKKEPPVMLADGKVRVIGYETIPNEDERHTFYQCAAPLSTISAGPHGLYDSSPDEEGFSQAVDGVHILPFALEIQTESSFGSPKGVLNMSSGITVRYIAMVSLKVKDSNNGRRSIAHFYRNCEIWPRLDIATTLTPAPRPLHASTAKSISILSGSSSPKVKLSAQLSRLNWPAGVRCPVTLLVNNGSKKTIRSLLLTLVRTTTVFRPRPMLDAVGDHDPDACQTTTTHKVVAESLLEMCARVSKGHASAKGWWTGVGTQQELEFTHYILLPPDAISIARGRLLEVEYSVRITLSAGSLTSDISVTLPIRIFNFISIDQVHQGTASRTDEIQRPSQICWAPNDAEDIVHDPQRRSALPSTNKPKTAGDDDGSPLQNSISRMSSLRSKNSELSSTSYTNSHLNPSQSAQSDTSVYSSDSAGFADDSGTDFDADADADALNLLARASVDLDGDIGSDEEIDAVLGSVKLDEGCFRAQVHHSPGKRGRTTAVGNPGSKNFRTNAERTTGVGRMEGVGSGMKTTSFSQRVREKKLAHAQALARLRELQDSSQSTSESSDSLDSVEEVEEETPRLGYSTSTYSDSPAAYICDEQKRNRVLQESRQLPRLPSMPPNGSASATGGSHRGTSIHSLPSFERATSSHVPFLHVLMPTQSLPGDAAPSLSNAATALTERSRTLPTPSSSNSVSTYPSDPELLRQVITRPPVRRAVVSSHGSSSGGEEMVLGGEETSVKRRIVALEEKMMAARGTGVAYT